MKITHDHVLYWLFLDGYSLEALGKLLFWGKTGDDNDEEDCARLAEDAVRREVNRLRQHKKVRHG